MAERSIIVTQSYGTVVLHLREMLESRGMNRNQLASAIHVNFAVVDRWYRGKIEKLDLDILARICYVLDCEVSELLEYRADAEKQR